MVLPPLQCYCRNHFLASKQIEAAVRGLGLEGVVAKRLGSRYERGKRSDAWVKVKFSKRQEFVIGRFKPAGDNLDSILVGYYEGKKLLYARKVRAGFTPHLRADVFELMKNIRISRSPFANLPNSLGETSHWGEGITADEMKTLAWVKSLVVVEVAFTEWTHEGNLRHAAFVGVRKDKAAREVSRES
jgi:bifunctional non-homologous end joining protein LigD